MCSTLLYPFRFWLQNFRDQRIDGSGLPLLTEEHLTTTMNMKLGPALKLRSILAKKLGSCSVCLHCTHCHNSAGSPEPSNTAGNTSDSGGASWMLTLHFIVLKLCLNVPEFPGIEWFFVWFCKKKNCQLLQVPDNWTFFTFCSCFHSSFW